MSHLKDIVVELHNCVHEFEPDTDIPMMWSREFQQKLAQNASHWNDDQRRASQVADTDVRDEEDDMSYAEDGATFSFGAEEEVDPEVALDATLDFEHKDFKTKWGEAFHRHQNPEPEVDDERSSSRLDRLADFLPPREEEEEEEDDSGLNFTQDPDKVAKAKKLRDRAVKARDKARSKRDQAKEQRAEEKGEGGDVDGEMGGDDERDEEEDENLAGTIRTIPKSHLVFKRQQEDGTFDELWHYNVGQDFKSELKIRRAILAGTDIPINKMKSPDGSQTYELWTIGNGQMLKVQGLPN